MMLVSAYLLVGCMARTVRSNPVGSADRALRSNCYGLLHQVLDEQKDVGLLRFIKREHEDVKELVKRIAAASGAGAKLLEILAQQDPSIDLQYLRLPPGEVAAREAIGKTKKKELLGQKGDRFELSLLLTQTEALVYAGHLAKVGALNEVSSERARALSGISDDMLKLNEEIVALLLAKISFSRTN